MDIKNVDPCKPFFFARAIIITNIAIDPLGLGRRNRPAQFLHQSPVGAKKNGGKMLNWENHWTGEHRSTKYTLLKTHIFVANCFRGSDIMVSIQIVVLVIYQKSLRYLIRF